MIHNLLVLAVAALIPLIVGSAWYSPLLFAKPWMAATGMTEENAKKTNMVLNMALLYVFSFFISAALLTIVIHQYGLFSLLADPGGKAGLADHNSGLYGAMQTIKNSSEHSFRTYKHGALHGAILSVFLVLPLISSCAIFEGRGFKYIMITWGFWLINLVLMGAVICHWFIVDWPTGAGM